MLKFTPIILGVIYALVIYWLSASRTKSTLDAQSVPLADPALEQVTLRLDSLGYARYGFGSERNVRARLREIASLVPGGGTGP